MAEKKRDIRKLNAEHVIEYCKTELGIADHKEIKKVMGKAYNSIKLPEKEVKAAE